MSVCRVSKGLIHAVGLCLDCDKEFDNYLTAQRLARAHAEKMKHIVSMDLGYAITYNGKPTP